MRILGKDKSWETPPIPSPALTPLRVLETVQRPASDDWPVFATSHGPSKWAAAREQLDADVDALVEDLGSSEVHVGKRVPPALTTDGARDILERSTEAAAIDVGEGYLRSHGARRGTIGEIYKRDRGEAQVLGRHESMETTRKAYSRLDEGEQRERLNDSTEELWTYYHVPNQSPRSTRADIETRHPSIAITYVYIDIFIVRVASLLQ